MSLCKSLLILTICILIISIIANDWHNDVDVTIDEIILAKDDASLCFELTIKWIYKWMCVKPMIFISHQIIGFERNTFFGYKIGIDFNSQRIITMGTNFVIGISVAAVIVQIFVRCM